MNFIKKIYDKLNNIKNKIFKKEQNKILEECKILEKYDFSDICLQCIFKNDCKANCQLFYNKELNNNNFLLIDDNFGTIMTLEDIVKEIIEKDNYNCDIKKYYTKQAPLFVLKDLILKKVKFDCALIDLTYGNILKINEVNIKLNGMHVFYFLLKNNPNLKFRFYTGNVLNPYIKNSKNIIDFFKELTGEDIDKYLISKSDYDDEKIESEIKKMFSELKVNEWKNKD